MGTIIYGDLEEILQVLRKMHESCFEGEVNRVLTQVKIDDRRDKPRQSRTEDPIGNVETHGS